VLTHVRAAIVSLVLFTVVTGVAYPALVTVIAQLVFPNQATAA
jgi:K+-transporting ATPase ATPase C chain